MNGIDGEKLDNFLKLRSCKKEDAAAEAVTVLGQPKAKAKAKAKARPQSHGTNIDMI